MDEYLPFKYGKLYKYKEAWGMEGYVVDRMQFGNIYCEHGHGGEYPRLINQGIDSIHHVLPVAFDEKNATVIAEIRQNISVETFGLSTLPPQYGYSSSPQFNLGMQKHTHNSKIPVRIVIPVADFIEKFEEVL